MSIETVRKIALLLPESEESLHFNLPAFKVSKKIYATIHENKNFMMVKLSLPDQFVFCSFNKEIFSPVPGGWGRHGSTFVDFKKVKKKLLTEALTAAWKNVASPKLVAKYFGEKN